MRRNENYISFKENDKGKLIYVPSVQFSPPIPRGHSQVYSPVPAAEQLPPFLHGLRAQESE